MSRGIPVGWEGAAPIGVVRDGLCGPDCVAADGKGVPAQLRDVVGQVCPQAGPRFTFIACGVDEYGFLGIRSVDLQYGVQGLRQVPSIPLQLRTDGAGDDIGIEHSRAIRPIDDVELRVVVSLDACEFIVEEIAGCGREYCNPPLHGFVCEGVCSLVVRQVLRDRYNRCAWSDPEILSGCGRCDGGPVRSFTVGCRHFRPSKQPRERVVFVVVLVNHEDGVIPGWPSVRIDDLADPTVDRFRIAPAVARPRIACRVEQSTRVYIAE